MKYKIVDDNTSCWYQNNDITIISVNKFNTLMDNNPKRVLIQLLEEDEILNHLRCPYSILEDISNIIINNHVSEDIIDILKNNNIPYFSFYICVINTYKKRYKYLLGLYSAKEVTISYNKNNIKEAIELAKYLKSNIILENTNIPLIKYKDILEKHFTNDMHRSDIGFYYQENNKPISGIELYNTSIMVNTIVGKVRSANLSPIESIMYIYDNIKKRIYKIDENNYHNSSDVNLVLTGDAIVCSGYSNVFNAILRCIDIPAMPLISYEVNHQRSIVYINDAKYNIDGVYVFDPTWDRKKDNKDNKYISRYNYFAIPLAISNKSAPDDFSSVLSLSFEEIMKHNDNIVSDESIEIIETVNKIFEFIIGKSFTDIESEAFDSLSANKIIDKINESYLIVLSKFNSHLLDEKTFIKILYNTRKAQFEHKIISSINNKEIKEAVIDRYMRIKLIELMSRNLESEETKIRLLIHKIELSEKLDRYLNAILFSNIPLNKKIKVSKTLKKKL